MSWKGILPSRRRSLSEFADGVRRGDRPVLAQAITLVESLRPDDEQLSQQLLAEVMACTGGAIRLGITGVPGVGKSTLLDSLGMMLIGKGHSVAVLAVDPSSSLSGGSILGDKTRMHRLAAEPRAFVRPSPSSGSLGGVARRTRESMLLCEAAGFDVVIVETVGVGQSEIQVSDMVDCFVALMLPGGGDELQGIKKGIIELADILAVNKADGDNMARARSSLREYRAALRYIRARHRSWRPESMVVSGLTGAGLEDLWSEILRHRQVMQESGELASLRSRQRISWTWAMVQEGLMHRFRESPEVRSQIEGVLGDVESGKSTATAAAWALLDAFSQQP
jgi:LAO/AO transport system kinase